MPSRRYLVSGRVQGVGFRWWTRAAAGELGLAGSVRNRSDGSVEVTAAGPASRLEEFERRLRDGPPAARVNEVKGEEAEEVEGTEFEITP
ncbi:MAG: acylphosphatase [Longimicrobiaceae bacterium]